MSEEIVASKETVLVKLRAIAAEGEEHIHTLYKNMVPDEYIALLRNQIGGLKEERDLWKAEAMAAREYVKVIDRDYVYPKQAFKALDAYTAARKATDEGLK